MKQADEIGDWVDCAPDVRLVYNRNTASVIPIYPTLMGVTHFSVNNEQTMYSFLYYNSAGSIVLSSTMEMWTVVSHSLETR